MGRSLTSNCKTALLRPPMPTTPPVDASDTPSDDFSNAIHGFLHIDQRESGWRDVPQGVESSSAQISRICRIHWNSQHFWAATMRARTLKKPLSKFRDLRQRHPHGSPVRREYDLSTARFSTDSIMPGANFNNAVLENVQFQRHNSGECGYTGATMKTSPSGSGE